MSEIVNGPCKFSYVIIEEMNKSVKKIKTEPIPERVLEICRIISLKKAISEKELIAIFEPPF